MAKITQKDIEKISRLAQIEIKDEKEILANQIENVIKHLKSSTTNLNLQKQFKKHTDYYDSIRNKKFIDTFPELAEFYENIL